MTLPDIISNLWMPTTRVLRVIAPGVKLSVLSALLMSPLWIYQLIYLINESLLNVSLIPFDNETMRMSSVGTALSLQPNNNPGDKMFWETSFSAFTISTILSETNRTMNFNLLYPLMNSAFIKKISRKHWLTG